VADQCKGFRGNVPTYSRGYSRIFLEELEEITKALSGKWMSGTISAKSIS
jgi:hypothetical protein